MTKMCNNCTSYYLVGSVEICCRVDCVSCGAMALKMKTFLL